MGILSQRRIRTGPGYHHCFVSDGENLNRPALVNLCGGGIMKKLVALLLLAVIFQSGCAFFGGAAVGRLLTRAGLGNNKKKQKGLALEEYFQERDLHPRQQTRSKPN